MEQQQQPSQRRKRKKLNIPFIKGMVMLGLGTFVGFLSALTGISPQIAAVGMIVFLLGFQPQKAQGTALAYSLCTAIGGVAGATAGGIHPDYAVGFIIAFGATLGAIFVGRAARGPNAKYLIRIGQTLAIFVAIYVIGEAIRHRVGGPRTVALDFLIQNRGIGAFLVGVVVGIVAQLFQVTTGVFLVPALIYLATQRVPDAITTSLLVVAIASLLPTISYSAKQAVDKGPGYWMCVGGALGGLAGGVLLGRLGMDSFVPLALFGLGAMMLSGWTLSKLAFATDSTDDG